MMYLSYPNKVPVFRKCPHCDGNGNLTFEQPSLHVKGVGEILMGTVRFCGCCQSGYLPMRYLTRGKSLPPIMRAA